MRHLFSDLEREEEAAPRRVVPAAPAPHIARMLALQSSAGNQAVSRMIARMSDEDLDIEANEDRESKKLMKTTRETYHAAFGLSGKYKDQSGWETWDFLVRKARSLKNLAELVKKEVEKAETVASQPKPVKEKEPEKEKEKEKEQTTVSTPSTSSGPTSSTKKSKVTYKAVDPSQLGFTQTPISSPSTTPTGPSQAIVTYTQGLNSWQPSKGHGGKDGTNLTLVQAQELVDWAQDKWSRKTAVYHARGEGSGQYAGQQQLKFIHKSVDDTGSGKKATYHITLKSSVLSALTGVEDLDY